MPFCGGGWFTTKRNPPLSSCWICFRSPQTTLEKWCNLEGRGVKIVTPPQKRTLNSANNNAHYILPILHVQTYTQSMEWQLVLFKCNNKAQQKQTGAYQHVKQCQRMMDHQPRIRICKSYGGQRILRIISENYQNNWSNTRVAKFIPGIVPNIPSDDVTFSTHSQKLTILHSTKLQFSF